MWTLSVPGLSAVREAQPATLLDLAPTVLTALGLAPPGDWPGRTLLPPMQRLRPCPPLPADSTSTPTVQPMTLAVVPPASLSAEEQLAYLTRELDKLNAQTSELVRRQPSVGRVYQQQLAEMFPDAHLPINPNQIFYSRYREDQEGQKHLLSCEPLGSLLATLRAPGAESYLTQESGAFYRECNTLDTDKILSANASTTTLAARLEIAITLSLNTFWGAGEPSQANTEEQLVALRRQVLAHQLALRSVDGTLSAHARTLAQNVLGQRAGDRTDGGPGCSRC